MTELTTTEIKILVIQILFMAIMGVFVYLYSSQPIVNDININTNAANQTSVDSQGSWINNLISLPAVLGDLFFVTALIITPFLLFDAFIALRFVKDLVSNWI